MLNNSEAQSYFLSKVGADMFLTLFLGVIAAILVVVFLWIVNILYYKSFNRIPGPVTFPIVGSIHKFWNYNEILPTLVKLCNTYGPIVRIWQGFSPIIIVSDRDLTEFILRSPKYIVKPDFYHFGRPWLGSGILASDGEVWKRKRKIITPAFHFKILEDYITIFENSCDILVDILSTKVDKGICNIEPIFSAFTLDIIAESAMGAKLNAQRQPKSEYVEAISFMAALVLQRTVSCWKKYEILFRFTNEYRQQQKACKIISDLTLRMIQERKKQLLEYKKHNTDKNNTKNKTLFLDILLNTTLTDEPLSDEEIRDEVNSFMFGGHDTTASALCLMLYELSNNQEVQNKLVEELKVIFGNDKDRPSTIQETCEMKYMDCVIKEMMRYYSPVPMVGRKLIQDLEYNGIILPNGLTMIFFFYGMHNSPAMFHKPEVFNPDRFLLENSIKAFSYIPFSAGSRNCLGQKYAMYELKVTLAKVLRHFQFSSAGPEHKLKLLPEMVMKSINGVNVNISRRDF